MLITWEQREALAEALHRLHLIDLNHLYEVVDAVVAAGWQPRRTIECDRWLQSVKAAAWEEGALWCAVEFTGDDRYEKGAQFLAPGDNPYEPTMDATATTTGGNGRRVDHSRKPSANETFTTEPSPTKPLPKKEQG